MEEKYLEAIITPLLSQTPQIEKKMDERGVLLTLSVCKADMGRIIGKNGDTARAIRRLLRQYGMNNQAIISLKINEPNE